MTEIERLQWMKQNPGFENVIKDIESGRLKIDINNQASIEDFMGILMNHGYHRSIKRNSLSHGIRPVTDSQDPNKTS